MPYLQSEGTVTLIVPLESVRFVQWYFPFKDWIFSPNSDKCFSNVIYELLFVV